MEEEETGILRLEKEGKKRTEKCKDKKEEKGWNKMFYLLHYLLFRKLSMSQNRQRRPDICEYNECACTAIMTGETGHAPQMVEIICSYRILVEKRCSNVTFRKVQKGMKE